MGAFELAIALGASAAIWWQTNKVLKEQRQQTPQIHECSMMGHDYQPVYDESGGSGGPIMIDIPKPGPFMDAQTVARIAEAKLKAASSAPKQRIYVHSVCRYCGITVDRPEKK